MSKFCLLLILGILSLAVIQVTAKNVGCRSKTLSLRRGQQFCRRICVKTGVRSQCRKVNLSSRVSVCPVGCCQLGDSCVSIRKRKF